MGLLMVNKDSKVSNLVKLNNQFKTNSLLSLDSKGNNSRHKTNNLVKFNSQLKTNSLVSLLTKSNHLLSNKHPFRIQNLVSLSNLLGKIK